MYRTHAALMSAGCKADLGDDKRLECKEAVSVKEGGEVEKKGGVNG